MATPTFGSRGILVAALVAALGAVAATALLPVARAEPGGHEWVSGESVGVPECDTYIRTYATCLEKLSLDKDAMKQMWQSLAETRKAWREAAATPEGKTALAHACAGAIDAARAATESLGCEWPGAAAPPAPRATPADEPSCDAVADHTWRVTSRRASERAKRDAARRKKELVDACEQSATVEGKWCALAASTEAELDACRAPGKHAGRSERTSEAIGVTTCDAYVNRYLACLDKLGADVAAQMRKDMKVTRKAWKEAADTPEGREALHGACKQAYGAAKAATEPIGCVW